MQYLVDISIINKSSKKYIQKKKPNTKRNLTQGMVDGSASKPSLRQNTGYMVEKTYPDIAPYLGAFGAYLMPQ